MFLDCGRKPVQTQGEHANSTPTEQGSNPHPLLPPRPCEAAVLLKFLISFFIITYDLCSGCDRAEYEIKGECCPMCPPGTRVYKHCTRNSSTSCVPCIGPTFTDKPNGLIHCFPCTVCDKGEISSTSDTVCGALEGNYCIDPYEGGCRAAQKHTTCKPGYFIKHPGTDSTDAVCEKCPENSYSVESSTSCTPHTQ
uniref:TNFR-Cys domain-containing protein n=1 Tax=Scleropages formosus TaxID=113540 RepID=A0A8C9VQW0_SCLFO